MQRDNEELLKDLYGVWENKPVGYLPIKTLTDICQVSIDEISTTLREKWLTVLQLNQRQSNVRSGALYAYHDQALRTLLQSQKSILEKNKRPLDPDKFIRKLRIHATKQDLFNLIADAFGDKTNQLRT